MENFTGFLRELLGLLGARYPKVILYGACLWGAVSVGRAFAIGNNPSLAPLIGKDVIGDWPLFLACLGLVLLVHVVFFRQDLLPSALDDQIVAIDRLMKDDTREQRRIVYRLAAMTLAQEIGKPGIPDLAAETKKVRQNRTTSPA